MNIKQVDLQQGTQAWLEHRTRHYNASDAAAALGLSRYKTRQQLMREMATGIVPEIDDATQRRFDKGHEFEAIARPWAEEIIGAELYPVVLAGDVDGMPLSASLDGLTMLEDVAFEHKSGNGSLLASLEAGVIPDEYKPQMEQCLLLSGATKCLFMASSGDRDAMRFAWYESDPVVRKNLLAGWAMFDADLAEYRHTEPAPVAIAEPQMALPSVSIQVNGSIALIDNLDVFGEALTAYVERINTKPETDDDFATLEATVKTLKKAEDALDSAENGALAQAASIDTMRRTVAMLRDMARSNRLLIDKLVKAEKTNRKAAVISDARQALDAHVAKLNERIGGRWMPAFSDGRFAEAVAGLKSLDSMRDKVMTALAHAKIEANEIADLIERNEKALEALQSPYVLAPDFGAICTKSPEDFDNLIAKRAAEAKEADDKRLEGERERIRQEEADRISREAARADLQAKAQAANDQRGKADAGSGELQPQELRQQPDAAITPPTQDQFAGAGNVIDSAVIDDFLRLLAISPAEKKALRERLVAFEKYRIAREMQATA